MERLSPGDVIESAIWLTGDESKQIRTRYELDVTHAIQSLCREQGFTAGPIRFTEKRPEEDRVPEVPDHISGPRVRLLVAEAIVLLKDSNSFTANLDHADLIKLRHIIRKYRNLNDEECDALIDQLGPQAVLETLH